MDIKCAFVFKSLDLDLGIELREMNPYIYKYCNLRISTITVVILAPNVE